MESQIRKFSLCFVFLGILAPNISWAGAGISILGDATYWIYNNMGVKGGAGYGGGILLELPFYQIIGIETGGFYFKRRGTSSGVAISAGSVHIPGDIRVHFGKVVSLLVGAFYEVPGDQYADKNYGVEGGFRFNLPLRVFTSFFIEGLYARGLKKFGSLYYQDLHGLVGFTFGISDRRNSSSSKSGSF